MTWFRKYRPKKIEELHLTNVRQVILAMMAKGSFPQVLLFAGPKGTGKTSTSRIIGAMLNDPQNAAVVDALFFKKPAPKKMVLMEPDNEADFARGIFDGQSFVVQEMDAASNRGIDDVRSLRERVLLPPQSGKMSVFILDEAHMLTTEAFNALLKILEEPPPHVVFILATTELHKLPATIVSRCTKIEFRKANLDEIVAALKSIASAEKLKIESEVFELVAARADGSFRDAVKLLEHLADAGATQLNKAQQLLGTDLEQDLQKLLQAVLAKNEQAVCQFFEDLRQRDIDEKFFYKSLFDYLHRHLISSFGLETQPPVTSAFASQPVIRFLTSELLTINTNLASPIEFLPLELKLLELLERSKNKNQGNGSGNGQNRGMTSPEQAKQKVVVTVQTQADQDIKKNSNDLSDIVKNSEIAEQLDKDIASLEVDAGSVEVVKRVQELGDKVTALSCKTDSIPESPPTADEGRTQLLLDRWEDFVRTVAQENPSLAALLRSSTPLVSSEGTAKVGVYYRFHQEQLQLPKFYSVIEACSQKLVGVPIKFNFLLQEMPKETELKEVTKPAEDLSGMVKDVLM
ncbi:MAG: DNA polymerase III subunit gamma/tau [Patescibacteria group bacterium]